MCLILRGHVDGPGEDGGENRGVYHQYNNLGSGDGVPDHYSGVHHQNGVHHQIGVYYERYNLVSGDGETIIAGSIIKSTPSIMMVILLLIVTISA